MATTHIIQDEFSDHAQALRDVFDERFADPRSTRSDRFVWDYWHLPGQYTHLRTPAWEYFPKELYESFHTALVHWGRETLGCWDVSPPWLSCYVDGHQQLLHSDVPHGPWAWVFSLTPTPRVFAGGETTIVRPDVLDYWPNFVGREDREQESFVLQLEPTFNRLIVFDPRLPHGVSRVSGTVDPREGRLVIHGWFTEPKPFVSGAHSVEAIDGVLEAGLANVGEQLVEHGVLHGVLSVRLSLDAAGAVTGARTLADTVVGLESPGAVEEEAVATVIRTLEGLQFGSAEGESEVTVPILFR